MERLIVVFRQQLNRRESMSLETLWDVIFGSKPGESPSWSIDGAEIEYFGGDQAMYELMKKTLEEKPWEDEAFLARADERTREFIQEQEQETSWFGTFLGNIRSVHSKIVKIELS